MARLIPQDGLYGPQRYLAIMVISCATILTAMDSTLVNIALPTMMVDLNVTAASAVLIINASQVALLVALLPLSALGALVGYRRVYLTGMIVFSAACIGCALSQTLEQIVVARTLQGLGAAGVVGVQHAMVRHIQDNVEASLGFRPPAIISLGGTDCRFWRAVGVPAYVYGPSPSGMGAPNESVAIDEFLHVVRTHALSAYDYLSGE